MQLLSEAVPYHLRKLPGEMMLQKDSIWDTLPGSRTGVAVGHCAHRMPLGMPGKIPVCSCTRWARCCHCGGHCSWEALWWPPSLVLLFLPLARAAWRSCALLNLPSRGSSLHLSLWPPLTCDRPILPDCSVTFLTSPSFPTSWPSPAGVLATAPGGTEMLARAMGPGPAQGTAMEASCRPCPAWRRSRRLR